MKKPKFKVEQLVVVKENINRCGCDYIAKDTIMKVKETNTEPGSEELEYRASLNKDESAYVYESELRALLPAERKTAKSKFESATKYNYASVN